MTIILFSLRSAFDLNDNVSSDMVCCNIYYTVITVVTFLLPIIYFNLIHMAFQVQA